MDGRGAALPTHTRWRLAAACRLVARRPHGHRRTTRLLRDRIYNGDFFLQLLGGRFVAQHGFTFHDPFPTIVQGRPWLNEQWLAELIFYGITRAIGFAGLATAYATMLALSGGILLWACRKKGALLLLAAATCFLLGVLTFVHPRAAGFSVLGFSALAAFLAWTAADTLPSAKRVAWALIGAPLGIALWANLHGGFLAGLLLIALFTLGLAIDVWRGQGETRHVWLGAACVLLSLAAVTLATPLGSDIWTYIVSLSNPAIPSISTEWGPTYRSLPEMLYLGAAAALALSLWWRSPAPRRAMPLLVVVGFLGFGLLAARNLIFLGPVVAFMIVCAAPDRPARSVGRFTAASLAAALSLAATLALVLGPPHSARPLGSPLVSYAIAHPPRTGRIAAYAGIGSYLLWRDPRTPTVLDGWLEHFTPFQLIGTYAILDGRATTNRMLNRWESGPSSPCGTPPSNGCEPRASSRCSPAQQAATSCEPAHRVRFPCTRDRGARGFETEAQFVPSRPPVIYRESERGRVIR